MTDGGTDWEARYSVSNDGAVLRAIEGEVRHSHPIYGDFAISRWLQEDDIERYKRFGGDRFGTPTSARPRRDLRTVSTPTTDPRRRERLDEPPRAASCGGTLLPRRRAAAGGGYGSRSRSGPRVPAGSRGSSRRSRGWGPVARSRSAGASLARVLAPRLRRVQVTAKIGDAMAVANTGVHKHGGSMSTGGGIINSDGIWVTSDTWESGGVSQAAAPAQSGRAGGGEVRRARGGDGHVVPFHRGVQGWHVDAKAILSPNGIATPEFTLHPSQDF